MSQRRAYHQPFSESFSITSLTSSLRSPGCVCSWTLARPKNCGSVYRSNLHRNNCSTVFQSAAVVRDLGVYFEAVQSRFTHWTNVIFMTHFDVCAPYVSCWTGTKIVKLVYKRLPFHDCYTVRKFSYSTKPARALRYFCRDQIDMLGLWSRLHLLYCQLRDLLYRQLSLKHLNQYKLCLWNIFRWQLEHQDPVSHMSQAWRNCFSSSGPPGINRLPVAWTWKLKDTLSFRVQLKKFYFCRSLDVCWFIYYFS